MPAQYTIPPDTRAPGTGNPPADINALTDAVTAMGGGRNILNTALGGGADPTGTADSTAAFTAAATAGGAYYVPAGNYKITSAIVPGVDTAFFGDGQNLSVLRAGNATTSVFDTSSLAAVSRLRIENIGIVGPGSGSGTGIKLATSGGAAMSGLSLRNLIIYGMGGDGLQATSLIVSEIANVTAQNCGGRGIALLAGGTYPTTSTSVMSCYANGNTGAGFYLNGCQHMALHACPADLNGGAGFDLEACEAVALNACGAYHSAGPQFKIGGASIAVALNACDANATQTTQQAFWVTGNSAAQLSSCNELIPSGSPVSLQIDAGSSCLLLAFATAAGTYTLNGTLTSITTTGSASISSTTAGLTVGGVLLAQQFLSSLAGGGRISQGSGAPSKPNGANPTAGDTWFRTDTPSTGGQRIYVCTTGGAAPVWTGIA